jgi:integrase/recombinase XerD
VSAALCELPVPLDLVQVADGVYVRAMLTTDRAVDLFLGDLARRGYSDRTRTTYSRILDKLCDRLPDDHDVAKITADDLRRFLDQWNRRAPGTRAHVFAVVSSFFGWLYRDGKIRTNPLDRLERPRRLPAEDLDVVTVTSADVVALLENAHTWTERLAIGILAYLGPRRHATALLRLSDYDRARRTIRFREKGGKTIWKPVPDELVTLLEAAIAAGAVVDRADYLIPPEGPLARRGDRDDRIIWRVVNRVATRAGVRAHVHALRSAFAVFYLEQRPGDVEALQALLGHRSLRTTEIYLRKLNRGVAMERVRDLSWTGNTSEAGSPQTADDRLAASRLVGAGGFEPPWPDSPGGKRADSLKPLERRLDELRDSARGRSRST